MNQLDTQLRVGGVRICTKMYVFGHFLFVYIFKQLTIKYLIFWHGFGRLFLGKQ
jgi:hypothetical protein